MAGFLRSAFTRFGLVAPATPAGDLLYEVDAIGAEPELGEVLVAHLEGALLRAIVLHRGDLVLARLDLLEEGCAALAAQGARIGVAAERGRGVGGDEVLWSLGLTEEVGELRLSGGPPGDVAEALQPCLEILPQGFPLGRSREGCVQQSEPLQPGLEGALPALVRCVPDLEIVEDGADFEKRVDGGIVELDGL